jgi:hypothetical protein
MINRPSSFNFFRRIKKVLGFDVGADTPLGSLTSRPGSSSAEVRLPRGVGERLVPQSGFGRRWLLMGLVMIIASMVQAQYLPLTRLNTVYPMGGKAGSTNEVEVTGLDLEEVKLFTAIHPGITAKPKEGAENRFIVTIAPNVPTGFYEVRIGGRFGLSNPRAFLVSDHAERLDPGGNSAVDKAVELPLNMAVHGRADGNLADYYRVQLKAGQRVGVECLARELDSRLEPAVTVLDANGKELLRRQFEGQLNFTAPADGTYLVRVSDALFRGGAEYFYRLEVTTVPQVEFAVPSLLTAGKEQKVTLYGHRLPGAKASTLKDSRGQLLEQVEVSVNPPQVPPTAFSIMAARPASAGIPVFEYRFQGGNPVLFELASAPVVLETEPNQAPAKPQKLTLPAEISGQFYPARDRDYFDFEAQKGQVWWVEVIAQRLGQNCDPFLLIQRVTTNQAGAEQLGDIREAYDSDANIGGREFNTANRDPVVRLEIPENGTYRIQLRDLFNESRDNPSLTYHLSIRSEKPDFSLVAAPDVPPPAKDDQRTVPVWTTALRQGEVQVVDVFAFRRDNFNGEIELSVEGLTAGMKAAPAKIEAGRNTASVLLMVEDKMVNWAGTVWIVGRSKIGNQEVMRQAVGGTVIWPVADFNNEAAKSRLTSEMALSVIGTEAAPIAIAPTDSSKVWEVAANGKVSIPLTVTRHGEYNAALKMKAAGLAGIEKLKELDIDGKATNVVVEVNVAELKLPEGTHSFFLHTRTTGKYRNNPEAATAAEQAAKEAEKAFNDASAETKKANEAAAAAGKALDEANKLLTTTSPADKAGVEAKAKAAKEAKAAAEKVVAEASAKQKEAEAKKNEMANRAKAATEKAKPRDASIGVFSSPITIKVIPAPVAAVEKK